MAYEDWSEGMQDVFDSATDILSDLGYYLSPEDFEFAQELFEYEFLPGQGATWVDVRGEMFFEWLGIPEELFDWDAWREEYEAA
jgi:hypothetical protein